ncbi:MAG: nuclear transport factor 2 family protein [Nitrospirota bacterium]
MMRTLVALCIIAIAGCGPVHHRDAFHSAMDRLNDQNDVIAAATRLFVCTDNRDWACVQDVFAAEVHFDMTSLGAPRAETKTPKQITAMWDEGLKALTAVHHQAGNFQAAVRGNEADLFCYGVAYHYLPNPTNRNSRTFVGSYTFHLVRGESGWKIDRFKFAVKFIDGNKDLEGAAIKAAQ